MADTGIGRILVASLHQGIAEVLPLRLEFYEHWLSPAGLRDGSIGLGPWAAVLSFLRREGEAYRAITARAGECAAEWTVAALPRVSRALTQALPVPLRTVAALQVARRTIRRSYGGSRAIVRRRKGVWIVDIRGSVFCAVREPMPHPLCGFYAAAIGRLLTLFDLDGEAKVSRCRAAGDPTCLLSVDVRGRRP